MRSVPARYLEDDAHQVAEPHFAWCMPADGQPLLNLVTIGIAECAVPGIDISLLKPATPPNRSELVIRALRPLQIGFEDPVVTVSWVASLHVLGRLLIPHGWDMTPLMEALDALAKRGLVLSDAAGQHGMKEPSRSCIYLQPVGAQVPSIEELGNNVVSSPYADVEPASTVCKGQGA